MGCFNSKGCFSNTPIVYGDKVVAFIGLADGKRARECDEFAPGMSFTPLSLPIHGEYNDYGGVENIKHTAGVAILEKFFGIDIETVIEQISSHEFKFDSFLLEVEKKDREFMGYIGYGDMTKNYTERYSFELVMEHEDVFNAIVKSIDIDCGEMNEIFYKDKRPMSVLLNEDYDKDIEVAKRFPSVTEWPEIEEKTALGQANLLERKVAAFHPNKNLIISRDRLTEFGTEVNSSFYMYPYKNVLPTEELKKDSVDFVSMMHGIAMMCMTWGVSNYCNQQAPYDETIMVLEATLKLMKKKRKKYNS